MWKLRHSPARDLHSGALSRQTGSRGRAASTMTLHCIQGERELLRTRGLCQAGVSTPSPVISAWHLRMGFSLYMYKDPSCLLLPGIESLTSKSDQNHSSQALLQEVWGEAQVPRVLMLLTDGRTTVGAPWPRTRWALSVRVRCWLP